MKYKKIMMLAILLLALLTVSAVSAEDNATDDTAIVEENNVGTFTDLASEIANATGELNLTRNYVYNGYYAAGISIEKTIIINGNGFTINGNDQSRIFQVLSSNVTLNNICFVNCSGDYLGGAIYWLGSDGVLANCNFVNCSAYSSSGYTPCGGAVYWEGNNGILANCSFENTTAKNGGAVRWGTDYGLGNNGILANCSFENTTAQQGGAVYWTCDNNVLANSSFVNCASYGSTYSMGGAVYWNAFDSVLANCSFENTIAEFGGAVYCTAPNGVLANSSFVNSSSRDMGGAVYWTGFNGVLANSSFINNSAGTKGGAVQWGENYGLGNNGTLANSSFINNSAGTDGGAVQWTGFNGVLVNSSFINNSAGANGGAVYTYRSAILVENCTFINHTVAQYNKIQYPFKVICCIFKGNIAGISENDFYPTGLTLTVPDFTSSYNSGDKLTIILNYNNGRITDTNITIKIYKRDNLIGTYHCLSGEGWAVNLNPGHYTALVSFDGNDVYAPLNATANVVVTKADAVISAVYNSKDMKLIATLTNGANGKVISGANVKVNINGSMTTVKTNSKGKISVSTADLPTGNYTATVSYKGNSKYKPTSTSIDFATAKSNLTISADYNADTIELVATLINEGTGKPISGANVQFNLKGTNIAVKTNSKGQAKLPYYNLPLGTYNVTISYNGNGKYNPTNTSIVVDVKTKVIITDIYGDSDKLVATLTNGATGNPIVNAYMDVEINGVTQTAKSDSKSQISIDTSDLRLTKYDVTISYGGNSRYTPSSTTTTINLNKANMMITYSYNANEQKLVATLKNSKTGNVVSNANMVVDLNGIKTTYKSNSKGQITFSTASFAQGTHVGTITYGGNYRYNSISAAFKVDV